MTAIIGHSLTEQRHMTVGAWEHLVRDVLPRVEAEKQLLAATAAAVPHMTADGQRETLGSWQTQAMQVVRQVVREAGSQVSRLRTFFRRAGINPDSGAAGTPSGAG